jgi:hypothetical protein
VPPLTPDAQKRQRARAGGEAASAAVQFDTPADFTLYDRCITRGLPAVMFPAIYNNNTRIVQAPGYVALTYEMIHETRVIPLDERPFASERIRGYLGDARARWEGDTLVVRRRTSRVGPTTGEPARRSAWSSGCAGCAQKGCATK